MRMSRLFALTLGAAVLAALLSQTVVARDQKPVDRPRVLVADVIINGSNHIPVDLLMARIKTQPGKEYSDAVVQEDIRTLCASKQFAGIVSSIRKEPDGRVTVFFTIRSKPSLIEEVVYQGNKRLNKEDLDKLTGIRKGQLLSPWANKQACANIVRKLNEDGRPFSYCDLLSGDKPDDTKVIFSITEGRKMDLRAVHFNGNHWASSGRLKALIQVKPVNGAPPTKYHPSAIEADIEKIKEYYKTFGFHDVKVQHGLEMTEDGRDFIVTYFISEGQRYTHQDQPPEVIDVSYEVEEKPTARVGGVVFVPTRPNVLLHGLPLYPGSLLTPAELVAAERNLKRIILFPTAPGSSPCRQE